MCLFSDKNSRRVWNSWRNDAFLSKTRHKKNEYMQRKRCHVYRDKKRQWMNITHRFNDSQTQLRVNLMQVNDSHICYYECHTFYFFKYEIKCLQGSWGSSENVGKMISINFYQIRSRRKNLTSGIYPMFSMYTFPIANFSSIKPLYDNSGLLLCDQTDRCDCNRSTCSGCFIPCTSCQSSKCGLECRT